MPKVKTDNNNTNSIYNSSNYLSSTVNNRVQNIVKTYNREHLLSSQVASELNTYLNFGIFPTFGDTYPDDVTGAVSANTVQDQQNVNSTTDTSVNATKAINGRDKEARKNIDSDTLKYFIPKGFGIGTPGVRSLFNRAGAIIIGSKNGSYNIDLRDASKLSNWRLSNNAPLMDSPGIRSKLIRKQACTIRDLVVESQYGRLGQETYDYSDFMYCKHLGKVSNNYLITLRRFPSPVDDFIGATGDLDTDMVNFNEANKDTKYTNISKNPSCIGCMVTWLGVSGNEMSNILNYSFKMPFKEQTAELQDSKTDADSNQTIMGGLFNAFDKSYQNAYLAGRAGESMNNALSHFGINLGNPPYTDHRTFKDRNKVYGPIDAIKTTYIRSDEGLVFKQSISIVFEYELRSYNGINPRQAMLDLISHILNVTYITGSFWGGGIKSYGVSQSNIFTNLKVFKTSGGFTDFADAIAQDLTTIGNKVKTSLGFGDGNFSLATAWRALKGALNTLGGMMMAGMLNKLGRPQKAMYNSMLSPSPIGFWHLTIGNPKAPIMSIGNMVLTNVKIEHGGPLGLDDFPTDLKVTVELDRGKPRDLRDIEKIYMHGNDRIYSPMSDKVFNMYINAEQYKNALAGADNNTTYNPVLMMQKTENGKVVGYESLNVYGVDPSIVETKSVTLQIEQDNGDSKGNPITYQRNLMAENTGQIEAFKKNENNAKVWNKAMENIGRRFGMKDIYSVFFAASEQEYGAAMNFKETAAKPAANTNNSTGSTKSQ